MAQKNEDLLRSTMTFTKFQDSGDSDFPIFSYVRDGKITAINEYIQTLQQRGQTEDIKKIVNSKDKEGKTPLQYSCYYSYHNLVMYLLMKGADPYQVSNTGKNAFHICAYMGHLKCAQIIYNFERHSERIQLLHTIKDEMNSFKVKKTDVKQGILISPDRHVRSVQERFQGFRSAIYEIVNLYLDSLIEKFKSSVAILDELNRNPIHYAAVSKFTKCGQVSQFILKADINIPGYDDFENLFNEVQLLELNKEKRIDPRQFLAALSICENFLLVEEYQSLVKTYNRAVSKIRKEIINEQDNDGYSPMHLASFNGDFAQVQFLLRMGGDPKSVDLKHRKQVLDFAESNSVRKYLVDLKDAARQGDKKSMNLLVNCGHDLNEKKTIFGVAPIHTAVEYYSKEKKDEPLKYAIKCDANLNISDSNGWTPLHHACKNGDLQVCQELIENYAEVNKFSNKGYYPIHVAAMFDHDDIIKYLVQNNANLEARDNQKCTPLILAAKKGNIKSVETLLNLGANIYAGEIRNFTALHYAAFNYHAKTVNLLCKYDADFEKLRNMVNSKGQVAKNLITNTEIQFALNTLWNSAREGNLDQVRKLTMLGHDINLQTRQKKLTPLILATANNHLLIVQYLLENGAETNLKDIYGKTAKDYAYDGNNRKIIALFEDGQEQQSQQLE